MRLRKKLNEDDGGEGGGGEGWSEPVWTAVGDDVPIGLTCILRMQSDGNLVFRINTLQILWESRTGAQGVAREEPYSRLELTGVTNLERGASLRIWNYVSGVVTKQLYPPPPPPPAE